MLTVLANTYGSALERGGKSYTNIEDRGQSTSVEKMPQRKGDQGSLWIFSLVLCTQDTNETCSFTDEQQTAHEQSE